MVKNVFLPFIKLPMARGMQQPMAKDISDRIITAQW
jgi:hypothetical protein